MTIFQNRCKDENSSMSFADFNHQIRVHNTQVIQIHPCKIVKISIIYVNISEYDFVFLSLAIIY